LNYSQFNADFHWNILAFEHERHYFFVVSFCCLFAIKMVFRGISQASLGLMIDYKTHDVSGLISMKICILKYHEVA